MKKLKSDVTIYVLAAEKARTHRLIPCWSVTKDLSGHIRGKIRQSEE